ncbi:MAG: RAMP superfamily CRISPR-associated protein [Micrococcales bacterium]|nr:RAMP superfamily CRISPR-associated protein [Micrococcales bacterium]
MNAPFTVRLTFASDWHVGSGERLGTLVDHAVALDPDGLPYVPAATLIGLLRERGETVVNALESPADDDREHEPGTRRPSWRDWHTWLFGSEPAQAHRSTSPSRTATTGGDERAEDHDRRAPTPAALTGSPLRLPQEVLDTVRGFPAAEGNRGRGVPVRADLKAAARVLRPGVRINKNTGTTDEDLLRTEERARAGLTVRADDWTVAGLRTMSDVEKMWPALVILHLAAQLLTTVGGKRRRGAGQVETLVLTEPWAEAEAKALLRQPTLSVDETPAWPGAVARLQQVVDGTAPPMPDHLPADEAPAEQTGTSTSEGRLRPWAHLDIDVTTPVVVAPQVRGNIVTSATHVPGASLIPLLRDLPLPGLGALLRDGRIRVTDAYPVHEDERCTPWPLVVGQPKGAAPDSTEYRSALCTDENLKAPRTDWYAPGHEARVSVPTTARTQAVVDDAPEGQQERDQAPFTYVGIAPGTRLRAQVWLPAGHTAPLPSPGTPARIGVARKDDNGAVRLTWSLLPPDAQEAALSSAPDPVAGSDLVLVAASDWLLTGPTGAPVTTTSEVCDLLAESLGCEVEPQARPGAMRLRRLESWQATWGLPRPTLVAVQAGSVFAVRLKTAPADGALRTLLDGGIGARRAEGFGQVTLGRNLTDESFTIHPVTSAPGRTTDRPGGEPPLDDRPRGTDRDKEPGGDDEPDEGSDRSIAVLRRAAWERAIVDAARVSASGAARDLLPDDATASQLGKLRSLVAELPSKAGRDRAKTWLKSINTITRRKDTWGPKEKALRRLLQPANGWNADHPIWEQLFPRVAKIPPGAVVARGLPSDREQVEQLTVLAVQSYLMEAVQAKSKEAKR